MIASPADSESSGSTSSSTTACRGYADFLKKHRAKKSAPGAEPGAEITNTIIGDADAGIFGGSFCIPDAHYAEFLRLYHAEVFARGGLEYLTEKQLPVGPILVDVDFRFALDVPGRVYTPDHVFDLVVLYLEELKTIYQFEEDTVVSVAVFEKPDVNRVPEKGFTKDGIHMIIGIHADRVVQCILRRRIVARIAEMWSDLEIVNTWDEAFDEGISKGPTNWQLVGSRKPKHDAYRLTHAYRARVDPADNELAVETVSDLGELQNAENFAKLSARCATHPSLFMTSAFLAEYNAANGGVGGARKAAAAPAALLRRGAGLRCEFSEAALAVRDRAQMDEVVAQFLDSLSHTDYEVREMYDYTMALPQSYYGNGSYDKWIRVGFALHNAGAEFFVIWVAFSAQSATFDYGSIADMYDKWIKFDTGRARGGLSSRSIMYWVKQDAPVRYAAIRDASIDFCVEETLDQLTVHNIESDRKRRGKGCADFDLATVLYQMFKDEFMCVSVTANKWYRFRNHRWETDDNGTSLRMMISTTMHDRYYAKIGTLQRKIMEDNIDKNDKSSAIITRINHILDIVRRLKTTMDKGRIMQESKEVFYRGDFYSRLDANPYLMCFANGVVDFKAKEFRDGRPEDFVSRCTGINYITDAERASPENVAIQREVETFMHQLFPHPDLHAYMWEHLASTLIGTSADQTFNMYIGVGQNGKSMLVTLMEKCLGEYKGDVPLTLITEKRAKVGGLSPEIVQLKGVRYAVIQEPSKGDRINEGVMKQLTGGDPIQGRSPYMLETLSFVPQFKLALCSNEFMEIKSMDHGTWRRIRVVEFESLFTDNPVDDDPTKPYQFLQDKTLKEKFERWSGVFVSMLVAIAFRTNGSVADCAKVLAATNVYRETQDYFSEFIREKVEADRSGSIAKTVIVSMFRDWYAENYGFKNAKPKDITAYMEKLYGKLRNGVWTGVRIRDETAAAEDAADITLEEI